MNYTFEQAKQAVAERHGYESFPSLVIYGKELPTMYFEEAAELLANEAVKSDRLFIDSCFEEKALLTIKQFIGFAPPLPFPEK